MTDPDPRYAGGCTPWGRYELPTLAGFLNEDLSPAWAQVTAWWQAHDLTAAHLAVMRHARERFVAVWPPATSEAATAFIDQVDALIASMETMRDAAEANGRALAGILTVLSEAKKTVDDLHEQWKTQSSSWETTAVVLTTGPVGAVVSQHADAQRTAALNAKAQAVMNNTDQSVYEYLPQLVVVPRFAGPPADGTRPYVPKGSGASGSSSTSGTAKPRIPPAPPPAPAMSETAVGPSLAGSVTRLPQGVVDGIPGLGSPPGQPGEVNALGSLFPGPGSAWVETPVGRALRAGAVLGEPPAGGIADDVHGSRSASTGSASASRAPETEPGMWGAGLGAGARHDRRSGRTVPADTEWTVPRGVRPVLEPGPEPVHDPGPGVIGIDR